ncbi:MAG TPA: hypothetical protein VF134_00755 [Candidatus Dormibacteraeota bacterium]
MTSSQGNAGQQTEPDGYSALIARARAAVPGMTSESLYRIRALLEQALAGERSDTETLAELARTLDEVA